MSQVSRRTQCALLLGAFLFGAAAPAEAQRSRPQNASRDIVGQSYDQIIERGYVLIGVYEDFPPWSWEEGGQLKGVDVDLGRIIADDLGVEVRYRAYAADENVDSDLRNNVWKGHYLGGKVVNVMMHVPYHRELDYRNELVVLTGQYFNEKIATAYDRETYPDGAPTPAYYRYDPVAVENDSLADFYLSGLYGGQLQPKIRRFTTPQETMQALREGAVPAVVGARGQLEFGAAGDDSIAVDDTSLPGLATGEWTLGVAVRHNYRQLGYAVDDAIRAAVQDGRLAAIFETYGLTYHPPQW